LLLLLRTFIKKQLSDVFLGKKIQITCSSMQLHQENILLNQGF
jgi:hypothetical protein